jgi:pSer/pThr/pTyr-binding forkhead associated (FHA) protein
MDEKIKILENIVPQAVLIALTQEAKEATPQGQRIDDLISIRKFPFRIGRESRVRKMDGREVRVERTKLDNKEPNNDLYLLDRGQLLNISREHLQIEKTETGYRLVDRHSACGTKLGGVAIGGNDKGGSSTLRDGEVIGIGSQSSPYRYRFITLDGYEVLPKKEE